MNISKTREHLIEAVTTLQSARIHQRQSDRPLRIRMKAESNLLRIGQKLISQMNEQITTDPFEGGPVVDIAIWRKHRAKLIAQFLIIGKPTASDSIPQPTQEKPARRASVPTVREDTDEFRL
jgi:hypothetical protein